MPARWWSGEPGLIELPDGRRVVGRGVREGGAPADLVLRLTWRPPDGSAPSIAWVRWPDFGLPVRPAAARTAIARAHGRAAVERVAVECGRGTGRTGAVLAVLAALSGVDASDAVRWVRDRYRPRAVETPWQRRWVVSTARGMTR